MKKIGIIGEYNPFHNGHEHLVHSIREMFCDPIIISTMSSSFVQRGEPAILDKWSRTRSALDCHVDLVIELPVVFSCQNAQVFARGALSTLKGLDLDYLAFGAEDTNKDYLIDLSQRINVVDKRLDDLIVEYLDQGMSYIKARSKALLKLSIIDEIDLLNMSKPNNILALEYIAAIEYFGLDIEILPIPRAYIDHNDMHTVQGFASATKIRQLIGTGVENVRDLLTDTSYQLLEKNYRDFDDRLLTMIRYDLLTADNIVSTLEYETGIENRIISYMDRVSSYDDLIEKSATSRLTRSRIRRILINSLLGIEGQIIQDLIGTEYIRILGASTAGFKVLRDLRHPYITKAKDLIYMNNNIQKIAEIENRATDIYATLTDGALGQDQNQTIIIKK